MKKELFKYLSKIDNWLYFILAFCLLGCIRNLVMLKYTGFDYNYFLTKVCLAMFVLYFAQSLFILLRQRIVFVFSLIQCIFCIYVYKDFTFLPLVNIALLIKNALFHNLTYGEEYFISFASISFLFSLELIKTYLLYALTDQPKKYF